MNEKEEISASAALQEYMKMADEFYDRMKVGTSLTDGSERLTSVTKEDFEIDKNYVAFIGDKCYDVYKSKEVFGDGPVWGSTFAIFDENDAIIARTQPFFGFDRDDIDLIKVSLLVHYGRLYEIYKKKFEEKV